jgi:hypothetical protein
VLVHLGQLALARDPLRRLDQPHQHRHGDHREEWSTPRQPRPQRIRPAWALSGAPSLTGPEQRRARLRGRTLDADRGVRGIVPGLAAALAARLLAIRRRRGLILLRRTPTRRTVQRYRRWLDDRGDRAATVSSAGRTGDVLRYV